jgi:pimeloyl-ACP methyl ester carboxylesterase
MRGGYCAQGVDGRGPAAGKLPDWAFGHAFPEADLAVLKADMADPAAQEAKRRQSFAHGVQGYVDDRRADAPGWHSFNVRRVSCPVTICHGEADTIVPVLAAHHTKVLLPHAQLRLFATLGHLSIGGQALQAAAELAKAHR